MNVFAIIRRTLWALVLAGCVVVGCLYLAVSQTFLVSNSLAHIVQRSGLAESVKNDILLPRVLASTRSSDYSTLLDDKTVTSAFNEAVTTDMLNAKLTPAIDALQAWLNSKEPSIKFSVNMTDISGTFADKLAEKINAKLASLPTCTRKNTLADAENGICRSPFVTSTLLTAKINQAIASDPNLQANSTLTQENLPLVSSAQSQVGDLPSYLNMLYAASLVTGGIIVLITLWLLFKHRFAGLIAIGAACLVAAIVLFAGSVLTISSVSLGNDPLVSKILSAAVQSLDSALQQEATWLAAGGSAAIIIGTIFLVIFARRHRSRQTMHMSSDTSLRDSEQL